MAPISIVQAVLAGGAVTLAVMAQRVFGDPVERRQWLALLLGGAGLALLVLTVPHFSGSHSGFAVGAMLGFEGGLALLAAGLVLGHRSERLAGHSGVLLAAIAGTLFALAGIAIKGLTGVGDISVAVLAPWVLLTILAGVGAQYAAAAALQRGGAIETIGLMGLVANAAQIVGGVLVFGDPLASSPARPRPAGDRLRDGLRLGAADPFAPAGRHERLPPPLSLDDESKSGGPEGPPLRAVGVLYRRPSSSRSP